MGLAKASYVIVPLLMGTVSVEAARKKRMSPLKQAAGLGLAIGVTSAEGPNTVEQGIPAPEVVTKKELPGFMALTEDQQKTMESKLGVTSELTPEKGAAKDAVEACVEQLKKIQAEVPEFKDALLGLKPYLPEIGILLKSMPAEDRDPTKPAELVDNMIKDYDASLPFAFKLVPQFKDMLKALKKFDALGYEIKGDVLAYATKGMTAFKEVDAYIKKDYPDLIQQLEKEKAYLIIDAGSTVWNIGQIPALIRKFWMDSQREHEWNTTDLDHVNKSINSMKGLIQEDIKDAKEMVSLLIELNKIVADLIPPKNVATILA